MKKIKKIKEDSVILYGSYVYWTAAPSYPLVTLVPSWSSSDVLHGCLKDNAEIQNTIKYQKRYTNYNVQDDDPACQCYNVKITYEV